MQMGRRRRGEERSVRASELDIEECSGEVRTERMDTQSDSITIHLMKYEGERWRMGQD